MEIKDIIEQQKLEKALERSKKKQDDFTRKEFLKDCYKFWKEYKKVEHPYAWWTIFLTLDYLFSDGTYFYYWCISKAPDIYVGNSWFYNKWDIDVTILGDVSVKRKANPSENRVWLY